MWIQFSAVSQDIIYQYNLEAIQHEGWVYIDIHKCIPGLKQGGKIANDRLCTHLKIYGYSPVRHKPDIWKCETRDIIFTLVMDDFGIMFTTRQDLEHLASALKYLYVITKDWEEKNLGLPLIGYIQTEQ